MGPNLWARPRERKEGVFRIRSPGQALKPAPGTLPPPVARPVRPQGRQLWLRGRSTTQTRRKGASPAGARAASSGAEPAFAPRCPASAPARAPASGQSRSFVVETHPANGVPITRLRPSERAFQNLGCGGWDVPILVDPVSALDQLQAERPRAKEPDREPQKTTPHAGAVRGRSCRKHSGSRAQGCC